MNSYNKFVLFSLVICLVLLISLTQMPLSNAQGNFAVMPTGETETTISIEWSVAAPPTLNYMNNYTVYSSAYGTNGPYQVLGIYSPSLQTISVYGLSPTTDYWFYVVANWGNAFGSSSGNSNTIEVSTAALPSLQYSSVTQTSISLSWIDHNVYSNLSSFQSYTVQIMPPSGSWSTLTTITQQSDNSYTVTGLSPGQSYSFQVYDTVAVVGSSNTFSSYSNVVTASTISPINAVISASATSISTGGSLQLTVTVTGGVSPYGYQWYVNGNPISGATQSSFIFQPTSSGTFNIFVAVTGSTSTTQNSNTITITVSNSILPSSGSGGVNYTIWIIIIGAIIAIVVAIMISVSKKKGNR